MALATSGNMNTVRLAQFARSQKKEFTAAVLWRTTGPKFSEFAIAALQNSVNCSRYEFFRAYLDTI